MRGITAAAPAVMDLSVGLNAPPVSRMRSGSSKLSARGGSGRNASHVAISDPRRASSGQQPDRRMGRKHYARQMGTQAPRYPVPAEISLGSDHAGYFDGTPDGFVARVNNAGDGGA